MGFTLREWGGEKPTVRVEKAASGVKIYSPRT